MFLDSGIEFVCRNYVTSPVIICSCYHHKEYLFTSLKFYINGLAIFYIHVMPQFLKFMKQHGSNSEASVSTNEHIQHVDLHFVVGVYTE